MNEHNPFEAPADSFEPAAEQFPHREYGGIGRGAYFGISFVVGIINNILQFALINAGVPEAVIALGIIGFIVGIVLGVKRLQNMGYSGWWILGLIVPILNIVVALRCLACPEGYADHKKLDSAGKIILGLFFGLILLMVLFVVLAAR